jgi:septal ring-binding cell division protein DamX
MDGLMSLPALKDLFARHRQKATGLWRLGQDPQRTVYLEHGDVVFAGSTHPLDRLTHLLVERGRITQAQLDYALANLNPGMSIGKNLIEMGFITQRDLLDVARAQVERVVWATLADDENQPAFEARELDATTVRLPFDTPLMLLSGVLNLRNREAVLEELGPLNQVVVLEGRRLQELTLPPDLTRLPALLDGSRTLLELSRESGVEPFRLGAFALFLREIGWARLHELPPLDRRALELALEPAQPPLSPALPEPSPEPQPSLFSEIRASQLPTTNLEHLSEALDQLGPDDELPDLPELGELPEFPEPPELPEPLSVPVASPEQPLRIHHEASGTTELPEPPAPPPAPPSRRALALGGVLVLLLCAWGGYRFLHRPGRKPAPGTAPAPAVTPAPTPAPAPASIPNPTGPTVPAAQPESPAPPPPEAKPETPGAEAKPEPKPKAQSREAGPASKEERFKTITAGSWKTALAQGEAQRRHLRGGKWTLRLEIACQGATVQRAAELLRRQDPDLFLLPMTMRDGRTCYQVFLGEYRSEAAALRAARRLPAPFLAEGNRPKPFRVAEIPSRQ